MIKDSGRVQVIDKIIDGKITEENYHNKYFLRVGSKADRYENIDFSHTYFDHCYFRNCVFDSCNFNGCKFLNSNFSGSTFVGCDFTYATFQNTEVDEEILDTGCPGYDNLKLKFARTLRKNFQGLGDAESANKAIKIELDARKSHLWKCWNSNESYYRKKYTGWNRFFAFFKWLKFKIEEFVWGNGESTLKLIRSGFIFWIIMTVIDVSLTGNFNEISSYWNSFIKMPQIFLSIEKPINYSNLYLSIIFIIRIVAFGLFMSILLKRFNKR
ncbi:pentapeptide repeat-containing protein [Seonamhaeicola maritimus]|uniref:Pentapeptide repeat-containing protein n=1 Tax=Seonamhaeicola maritimus TaxID=2591822 RepID=A0A5C7GIN6_9FLAO|nr:pentapeptide repeat-containing protein [Seonamhaeicola maritimus]TXG36975.1 pentapeptide repeat-containing protein [Seonamhaeicola maritimus]